MDKTDAIHLGKRATSDLDDLDAACKEFGSPTRYPEADFKLREAFGAGRELAQLGVLADIKNMLGEFSEKLRPLRQKVKSAARSEWLEHEAEAREKAKLGRERSKFLNRSQISPQTERELLNDQLHRAVRESRDTILRWDTFSSEFQNSKGWRECLRSILFKKSTGFIDMYYREVLCALPLMIETSDTLTSAISKPIAAFIMKSDVIDFVNLLPTEHVLSKFWSKVLGNQLSGSYQDGFEESSTPLDSNTSRLVGECAGSSKITLIDHPNSGKNFAVKFRDSLESASHILLGANLPASVMMAIKHCNYSSLPITLIGPESKHNLGSWFGDIEGFDVLRTNLISESFCNKLVTSTDGDKCEAIATHIASLYYKTEQSFKVMIPEGSSLLPRLIAKLKERGINENFEFTKSKGESSDLPQGRRITYEKMRNHHRHFQDGSLPQNDEIRIYMAAPMALESLQRIMVHCSAYKSSPSSIILMYNHEEAYRLRNEKTLSLASPELLLDILSKIQRSSEELPLNHLRVTRKEYGRNFELALDLASSLLREFESRGSVKFVSEYTTEYEVKLAEPPAGCQSDDLLAAISRKTTNADSNPTTTTLYTLADFTSDCPTSSTLSQPTAPPAHPCASTTPDPHSPQQQQLHTRLLELHRAGRLSLLRTAGVALCFRKVDSVSSAEMSAAFFAAHEDAVLRVKAFDLMTAALFNNGVVALEHIKKPRQNHLGEQLHSILNNYYTSPDKEYESLADESKCNLNIPHEVHYMHFQLTQRMISSVLKDLKTFLETEYLAKGAPKSEIPKSLQHNIFLHRFSGLIRGCQVMKSLCLLIQEAHLANRELAKHLDRLSKVCPLVLMELVEKNLDKLGLQ